MDRLEYELFKGEILTVDEFSKHLLRTYCILAIVGGETKSLSQGHN